MHKLFQTETLGFKLIVVIPGPWPGPRNPRKYEYGKEIVDKFTDLVKKQIERCGLLEYANCGIPAATSDSEEE